MVQQLSLFQKMTCVTINSPNEDPATIIISRTDSDYDICMLLGKDSGLSLA